MGRMQESSSKPDESSGKPTVWSGELEENDLEETFSRSSGPGGQNVNKVSTRVTLRHLPTGLTVTEQGSRSQQTNRQVAREKLAELLKRAQEENRQAMVQEKEKERRRNSPRPRKVKRRIREAKQRRSQIKGQRKRIRFPGKDE